MTPDQVSDIEARVALMRRLGVRRLRAEGVDLELDAPPSVIPAEPLTDKLSDLMAGAPQGDDALFWSVSGPLPSEVRDASKPPEE